MGASQSNQNLIRLGPRERQTEILIPGRKKPVIFEEGRRVDINIEDDADYFFYHLFRMVEIMVANSIGKVPTPKTSPRQIPSPRPSLKRRSQRIVKDDLGQTGSEMSMDISGGPKPMPTRAAAALSEYQDQTGYKCSFSLREIRPFVEECFPEAESPTPGAIMAIAEKIRNFIRVPVRSYFYNYRPNYCSSISIALANAMDWNSGWFYMPGSVLYLNEWKYLIEVGLRLYDQATGNYLDGKKQVPPRSYASYLIRGLYKDRSNVIIAETDIRASLARAPANNLIIEDCLRSMTEASPRLAETQRKVYESIQKSIGYSMVGK